MKVFKGKVVGIKMAKTITVEIERFLSHPLYKKRFVRSKKYQVASITPHQLNDVVSFVECPPISKTKRWKEVENRKAKPVSPKVSRVKQIWYN